MIPRLAARLPNLHSWAIGWPMPRLRLFFIGRLDVTKFQGFPLALLSFSLCKAGQQSSLLEGHQPKIYLGTYTSLLSLFHFLNLFPLLHPKRCYKLPRLLFRILE